MLFMDLGIYVVRALRVPRLSDVGVYGFSGIQGLGIRDAGLGVCLVFRVSAVVIKFQGFQARGLGLIIRFRV